MDKSNEPTKRSHILSRSIDYEGSDTDEGHHSMIGSDEHKNRMIKSLEGKRNIAAEFVHLSAPAAYQEEGQGYSQAESPSQPAQR
jgi:hypothetical protein